VLAPTCICFHAVAHVLMGFPKKPIEANLPTIGGGGLARLLCISLIVSRELGKKRLNAMLFGEPIKGQADE
jgi:hypothetical protein